MTLPGPVSTSTCPSHFLLDQWTLGELEHDARLQLERHIEHCPRCQARQAQRQASEADFVVDLNTLRELQQPAVAVDVESRLRARPVRWAQRLVAVAGVAAGLAVAITAGGTDDDATTPTASGVRAKGASSALFVQDAHGVRGLFVDDAGPARVYSGDTLQVAVTSATVVYVGVLSRDGSGQVSTYVAASDGALVQVSAGSNVPLPHATTLDDVVGPETVAVFVCTDASVHTSALKAVVVDGAPPEGCRVERYPLDKRAVH
jgi:hypothetical protein